MKRFLEILLNVKSGAAMVFCGFVMLYVVVGWFVGLRALSFPLVWQFLFISLICAVLQYIAFTEAVIKKMRYSLRLVVFLVPFYAVLSAFALGFGWFPVNPASWGLFTLIFLLVFAILTGVFEVYFRITGIRYSQKLDDYKSRHQD